MKTWKLSILGIAILIAGSAFAANSASIEVLDPVNVSGKQLAAGSYKVSWEGSGPAVELSILKGREVVAKVPAKLVDLPRASASDALVTSGEKSARELVQIQLGGKKYAFELGTQATQTETAASMK